MELELYLWSIYIHDTNLKAVSEYTTMAKTHSDALELAEKFHADIRDVSDINKIVVVRLIKSVVRHRSLR